MKKLVEVQEVENEGLISLLGDNVLIFCINYNYAGKLEGVNDTCVKLTNAGIVFETGAFNATEFKDFQKLGDVYVQTSSIESFTKTDKLK